MNNSHQQRIDEFMDEMAERNPNQPEFLQAVKEVVSHIIPFIGEHKKYQKINLLHYIAEPERVIQFRVPWFDDSGTLQVNRGYRVQFSSAMGPYKGGLRFHPSVNLSILKFLGFEQVFKNALTKLPLGGGKGGADFNPKGKSDAEVMRFCQSFMTELYRHIGPDTDIPAGDIGVGAREIGYLFGQYKRISNEFTGTITGKGISWGGTLIRPEATGFGLVYFLKEILAANDKEFKGLRVAVSGSGNVAQFAIQKLIEEGAVVISASDSSGYAYCKDGISQEMLDSLMKVKNEDRGRISDWADGTSEIEYFDDANVWDLSEEYDIALPCATQNEIDESLAEKIKSAGVIAVAEGANMPCTADAIKYFAQNNVMYAPGKATNAGGVAVSGLEMTQNATRVYWSEKKVDKKLRQIMHAIHQQCQNYGKQQNDSVDYEKGANLAAFTKVADSVLAQGLV